MVKDAKVGGKRIGAATIMNGRLTWRKLGFWRNLFLYFWVFGVGGHFFEVFWQWLIRDHSFDPHLMPTFTPLSIPYGLGAVAFILILWPIYKRLEKPRSAPAVLAIFVIAAVLGGLVEYICAAFMVATLGSNPAWDYSERFLNIRGYVCLRSVLLFGTLAVAFIYLIFPSIERLLQKTADRVTNCLFALLFSSYIIDLLLFMIRVS